MAVTPQTHPAATVAAAERVREGLVQIVQTYLAADRKDVVGAVGAIMALAAEVGQLRVGCLDDGSALTVCVLREAEQTVDLPLARSILRMMCANLAVRSTRPNELPPIYGGVAYLPPTQAGYPGFTLKLMNTMGEHWFDIAYQGKGSLLDRGAGNAGSDDSRNGELE